MKITKNKLKLNVPENKYLPSIQDEIRENLSRLGVSGLSVDVRYDVRLNVAMVRFNFKGKNYEIKISNQKDVRANMWAVSKRIEYKARLHLLDIEPFDISVSPYLMIEGNIDADYKEPAKANSKNYVILGIAEYASNDEIEKKYKHLCKTFHPDMMLSDEAKKEAEKRISEINTAYSEIKKERGM